MASETDKSDASDGVMTDEQIDNLVQFVESAERFAKVFKLTAPQAAKMMLTSVQIMARVKAGVPLATLVQQLAGKKMS